VLEALGYWAFICEALPVNLMAFFHKRLNLVLVLIHLLELKFVRTVLCRSEVVVEEMNGRGG